ncbi:hypothetical protein MRBLMF1_000336 [Streptomyces ossamyceticus]
MPRRSRRGSDAAREYAEALWRVLMSARPAGLHMPQLMRATELTRSQVRSGLAMLRDTIAKKGWPPLIYTRPTATSSPPTVTSCRHTRWE